jgi:uncharacterized protein (DUF427 family)
MKATWHGATLAESNDTVDGETNQAAAKIKGRVVFWKGVIVE